MLRREGATGWNPNSAFDASVKRLLSLRCFPPPAYLPGRVLQTQIEELRRPHDISASKLFETGFTCFQAYTHFSFKYLSDSSLSLCLFCLRPTTYSRKELSVEQHRGKGIAALQQGTGDSREWFADRAARGHRYA